MSSVLTAVLPIFALILAGYTCRRSGLFGRHACTELNRFVVYLALPALLFGIMAHATWEQLNQPEFIFAFGIGCGVVYIGTVLVRWRQTGHLADASLDGLNAAYSNTGFMGFPLGMIVFGSTSLAPTMIASIITVCILFAVAITLIEMGGQEGRRLRDAIKKVSKTLARNPLLISPILGALYAGSGLPLPEGVDSLIKLLGGAASPCALVCLGLFIGESHSGKVDRSYVVFVGLKLIVQPLITWILAFHVFRMPSELAHMAVILAAMPTGTGPFMLAELYQRRAATTSRTIMLSTILSVGTLSGYLYWMRS